MTQKVRAVSVHRFNGLYKARVLGACFASQSWRSDVIMLLMLCGSRDVGPINTLVGPTIRFLVTDWVSLPLPNLIPAHRDNGNS